MPSHSAKPRTVVVPFAAHAVTATHQSRALPRCQRNADGISGKRRVWRIGVDGIFRQRMDISIRSFVGEYPMHYAVLRPSDAQPQQTATDCAISHIRESAFDATTDFGANQEARRA